MTDRKMAKTARLKQRYAAEARFQLYGKLAIAAALSAVFFLLYTNLHSRILCILENTNSVRGYA